VIRYLLIHADAPVLDFDCPDDASAVEQVRGRVNTSAAPGDYRLYAVSQEVDLERIVGPARERLAALRQKLDRSEYERLRAMYEPREAKS
jgi:hypothetical protein